MDQVLRSPGIQSVNGFPNDDPQRPGWVPVCEDALMARMTLSSLSELLLQTHALGFASSTKLVRKRLDSGPRARRHRPRERVGQRGCDRIGCDRDRGQCAYRCDAAAER